MSDPSRSRVAVAPGSATPGTEEGRAFLQDRLGLYAMWVVVFAGTFYVFSLALSPDPTVLLMTYSLAHLGAILVFAAVWAASRIRAWSTTALRWMDAASLVLGCLLFAAMGGAMATLHLTIGSDPMQALLIGQLAVESTALTRAVAVPSTPFRTGWVTLAAVVPQVAVAGAVLRDPTGLPLMPGAASAAETSVSHILNVGIWSGLAVTLSIVASRIIFGLRVEVSQVRRLGQYTLEEKVGEGGMGVVYRASHAMLRRPTAIKLLSPTKAGEDSVRRFEREVQLTATLTHPSTVAVFDYGRTPDGLFYYAMEYLDGLNLDELVEEDAPQDAGRVIHILAQVSGALTEAHEAGLIHRDIKPANIILCQRGGVPDVAKVVDFGLVRPVVAGTGDATVATTADHLLTGTPLYMAPEVIRGEDQVDGRSDLYALGAVAYYLLTGTPVFTASRAVEILAAHLHRDPDPLSTRAARPVPPDLDAVVMRCLAKSPEERFATSRALTDALRRCAETSPWSAEAAALWWSERPARRETGEATRPGPADLRPTLEIDLAARGIRDPGPRAHDRAPGTETRRPVP